MPTKRKIQLNNISAVAASGTATLEVPLSFGRMQYLQLQHGYTAGTNTVAAAMTNITEIRIVVNGTVVRTMSGTELRDQNLLHGTGYDCTGVPNTAPGVCIPIFFVEPWRKDVRDQDALAWPSVGMESFQIEVVLGAASTPTLRAFAIVDDVVGSKTALVCKWIRQIANGGSTVVDFSTLERRGYLQQISIYPTAALTKVEVKKDGIIIHEFTKAANEAAMGHFGMAPTASGRVTNVADVVFDHDDLLGSAVPLMGSRDLNIRLESGSSLGSSTLLTQRLEAFD
jgi:hypothetical protein